MNMCTSCRCVTEARAGLQVRLEADIKICENIEGGIKCPVDTNEECEIECRAKKQERD